MSHLFFCSNASCSATVDIMNSICMNCWRAKTAFLVPAAACPDCGDTGTTSLGTNRCAECESDHEHPCNTAFVSDDEPHCTCNDSGRMCDFCSEEYKEPCRGCGEYSHLWVDDMYCRTCYVDRHGYEFPPKVVRVSDELKADLLANLPTEDDKWSFTPAHPRPLSPSPLIEAAGQTWHTLDDLRDIIAEIEERIANPDMLTKGQRDDWIWILQNRRADLAEAEKYY